MKTSWPMTPRRKVTPRESTTSPTGPTTNGNQSKDTRPERRPPKTSKFCPLNPMPLQSIGDQRVESLHQRTKDHAVHAGPSPPLVLWKVPTSLPRDHSYLSPNSNWLIAQAHTETLAAMADGWTTPSTTLKPTSLKRKLTTPTEVSKEPAATTQPRESPTTDHSLTLPLTTNPNSKPP